MAPTKKTKTDKDNKEEKALVIVESPAKSKTIKKMLGDNYEIKASYGHIRDFPKKFTGIDEANDYVPTFEVIPAKQKVVTELNAAAKKVDKIYLAPDPDREGEAIAWHIQEVLKFPKKKIYRIEFNEITKKAITDAVANPRAIDMDRVHAQQTRQMLDRLVGYKISPVLWEKLKNYRLSAGRVQSVAVRLICERQAEIDAFDPQEYWTVTADMSKPKSSASFSAELTKYKGEKIEITNEKEAKKVHKDLTKEDLDVKVAKVATRETTRNPQAPFITSTLQREASNKMGYGVSKTMQVAQKLYEGISVGKGDPVGLITYMRTDSTRISDEAQASAKEYITEHYGKKYYPEVPRDYAKKSKKNIQDAHEAIRPTYVDKSPESIKQYLTSEQYKLYKLIWERFVASQMESAKVKNKSVEISADDYTFRAGTSKVTFDGFLIVYDDRAEEIVGKVPDLAKDDKINIKNVDPKQHFTQPPPRYTEASLVKVLEEKGIGRPSTYAPIISKIQQRNYVIKEDKSLAPTELGKTVNGQLVKHFTNVLNYNFTAEMENNLDKIADKEAKWKEILIDFYAPFMEEVSSAKENMEHIQILSETDCPNCGKKMAIKTSRFGTQFLGCSGYPECKTMMPLTENGEPPPEDEETDEKCEKCGSGMVIKYGPYGKYLLCTSEDCKHKQKIIIRTGVKCPKRGCKGEFIQRKSRYGKVFYGCSAYPDCNMAVWSEPTGEKCPDCKSLLVKKFLKRGNKIACSSKECKYARDMDPSEE